MIMGLVFSYVSIYLDQNHRSQTIRIHVFSVVWSGQYLVLLIALAIHKCRVGSNVLTYTVLAYIFLGGSILAHTVGHYFGPSGMAWFPAFYATVFEYIVAVIALLISTVLYFKRRPSE